MIDAAAEREIHGRQLYIARSVFDLCEKHGIRCFLVGGSLLGAVKEGSILQGDKDVDIGMLREDYERFVKIASELPHDLGFLEARSDDSYNWLFAKVYQRGTKLTPKEPPLFGPTTGVYVDICPYDYVDEKAEKKQRKTAKLYKWFMLLKGKPSRKSIKLSLVALAGGIVSREKIIKTFAKGYPESDRVANLIGGTAKDWFYQSEIDDMGKVVMNDTQFSAPKWERYLDVNYPDWKSNDMSRSKLNEYEVEFE